MALNNNVLFNAALQAFVGAAEEGRPTRSATAADYAAVIAAGVVFATAMDTAIVNDASISQAGGAGIIIAGNAIPEGQVKSGLLASLVRAQFAGRYALSITAADYTAAVAAIFVQYTAVLASMVVP